MLDVRLGITKPARSKGSEMSGPWARAAAELPHWGAHSRRRLAQRVGESTADAAQTEHEENRAGVLFGDPTIPSDVGRRTSDLEATDDCFWISQSFRRARNALDHR
jgi:hypothetical protein